MSNRWLWGLALTATVVALWFVAPKLAFVVSVVLAIMGVSHFWIDRKLELIFAQRSPVDLDRFTDLLAEPNADLSVVAVVFEEVHSHLGTHKGQRMPVHPDDDLSQDLCLDPDDASLDLPLQVAKRLGVDADVINNTPFAQPITPRKLILAFDAVLMGNLSRRPSR